MAMSPTPAAPGQRQRQALVVVTGIQAAGKSTVARRLAEHFDRGVHVEADALQRMIVAGAAWPEAPGPVTGEAWRQLRLRLRHLCLLGRSFVDAGFGVVLDDIIMGERWDQLQAELHPYPFSLVVLAPRLEAVLERDRARAKRTLGTAWARFLDAELRATMAGTGLWIDNTDQTPDETVAEITRCLWPD
jgi:chloramphenicol 3-O-phosphotransferase